MAEIVVDKTDDVVSKTEAVVDNNEEEQKNEEAEVIAAPIKSKGGRPAGAKDKAPRKKKLTIVEEPLIVEPPAPPAPKPEAIRPKALPKPKPQAALPSSSLTFEEPVVEEPEPPSPRTIIRESSKNIMQLKHLADAARKTYLQDVYTQKLHCR